MVVPHRVLPWVSLNDELPHLSAGLDLQEKVTKIHIAHQVQEGREIKERVCKHALLDCGILGGGRFDGKYPDRILYLQLLSPHALVV